MPSRGRGWTAELRYILYCTDLSLDTLFGLLLPGCDDGHSMKPSYGGLLLPARGPGATTARPVGETQPTFLPFALLTQALKYLDPEVSKDDAALLIITTRTNSYPMTTSCFPIQL